MAILYCIYWHSSNDSGQFLMYKKMKKFWGQIRLCVLVEFKMQCFSVSACLNKFVLLFIHWKLLTWDWAFVFLVWKYCLSYITLIWSSEDGMSNVMLLSLPDCYAWSPVENKQVIFRVQSSTLIERLSLSIGLGFLKITSLTREGTA